VLHSIKRLDRCRILATDAEVGSVSDTYFDDARWVVRYLIVETRNGLHEHSVLISLSRRQIEGSPGIDTDRPVSRQHESEYHRYYGYPEYWPYTTNWARSAVPVVRPTDEEQAWAARQRLAVEVQRERAADAHLRSSRHVMGYHIEASDAAIGHIEDFLFDEETWAIRYAVVDTRNWLPGDHVLIPTERIRSVNWAERSVVVDMRRDAVRDSPTYDPDRPSPTAPPMSRHTSS
jgi:uncharacterized protein YrrD